MRVIGSNTIDRLAQACLIAGVMLTPLAAQAADAANPDPWEGVNRVIFRFNDTIDTYALKPVAQGYQWVTPQFMQDGVHNFFQNIGDVGNFANDVLQLKPQAAGVDTARLLLNTTLGVAGLVDVGTHMGLQRNDEDFGLTLGKWGVPSGPYVMIPLLGPSTVRDGIAKYPDSFTQPYRYMDDMAFRNSLFAASVVDTRAQLLSAEKLINGDKYVFIRNAYLQMREYKVKEGHVVDDF